MTDGFSRYLDLRQLAQKLGTRANDEWYAHVLALKRDAWWSLRPNQRALLEGVPRGD